MTRTIFLTLIGGLLAFTAGIVTVQSWPKPATPAAPKIDITEQPPPPAPEAEAEITPEPVPSEVVLRDGLRVVPEEVHLKSERLCYEIDVYYPQILGSDALHINGLNNRIRRFVADHYRWALNPSKAELRRFKADPEPYNLVNINYNVVLANDSILSIFFFTEDYYIGAAHSAIRSHVINYDLKAHRELKLADLFKPNLQYLQFIADYCSRELKVYGSIEPRAETFASWNFTEDGIQFNFDACQIAGCSSGPQDVTIPLSALKPFLKHSKWYSN